MSILKIWNEGQVYCCYRIRRGKRSLIIWELIRAYKHAAISQTSVPKVIFHCFPGANDSIIFYWRGRTGNIIKIKQSTKQNMTLKLFILQWKIWGGKKHIQLECTSLNCLHFKWKKLLRTVRKSKINWFPWGMWCILW